VAPTPDPPPDDERRRRAQPGRDDLARPSGPEGGSNGEPSAARPGPSGRDRGGDERDRHDRGAGEGAREQPPAPPPTPLTQYLGRIVLVLVAVAFGVFAVANSHRVDFSWVAGETQVVAAADGDRGGVPLIVLLLGSFAIGALMGALFEWQFLRKRTRPRGSGGRRGRRGR
jgi:uncharacterized integral membrane protein